MKISDIVSNLLGKYEKNMLPDALRRNKPPENASSDTEGHKVVPSDKVEISSEAVKLASLEGEATSRLEEIKAAIKEGTYNPPLDEVARSILEEWENE